MTTLMTFFQKKHLHIVHSALSLAIESSFNQGGCMAKATDERAMRMVPIPEDIYEEISQHASENGFTTIGVTCRALLDYLEQHVTKDSKKDAQNTENDA